MPWIKDVCEDVICGSGLGVVKGVFGISLFTQADNLKKLALSVMEKSPEVCEAIRKGQL